ncbi:hypothetical protein ACSQ67_006109 [Phaseolus vulgaris]
MQGGDEVSIEELASNLSLYKDQLHQVRQLLNDEPSNSEYVDMERELSEVIALTEELLATAKQNEISGSTAAPNAGTSPSLSIHKENQMLDSSSDLQEKLPIGTKVQGVWSEDGEWYDATIEAYTPNGYYVSYDNWGNKEEVGGFCGMISTKVSCNIPKGLSCTAMEDLIARIITHRLLVSLFIDKWNQWTAVLSMLVDPANIRPIQEGSVDALLEAERVAEATKQAIKRKIAQAASIDLQSRSLPAKLRIEADDPEDVKASKRKKIHAFKSKMRMEQLEVTQNKRQNAWQQFQSTKGKAKKIGFFSGRKRESIFKSPDDPHGKVGVTGSGKGLTEFQKREKHFHLKDGTTENDD